MYWASNILLAVVLKGSMKVVKVGIPLAAPRNVEQRLYHGASPGRWARKGASVLEPRFKGGCFLTPDPRLASMYCADWESRDDKVEFIQAVIDEVLELGDPEELVAHGFAEEDEDGVIMMLQTASAEHVLKTWSSFEISHYLVRRSVRTLHHYPSGAVMFPFQLKSDLIYFVDCKGHHFDDLPGEIAGLAGKRLSTDAVVAVLRGKVEVIWFMNLTDPAHSTAGEPGDTVYVYSPTHLIFHLTGQPVAV